MILTIDPNFQRDIQAQPIQPPPLPNILHPGHPSCLVKFANTFGDTVDGSAILLTSWYGKYPTIYRVSYLILGEARDLNDMVNLYKSDVILDSLYATKFLFDTSTNCQTREALRLKSTSLQNT